MPNSKRAELDEELIAEVAFTIVASLHQDHGGGENFLHEIFGKISVRNVDDETEEEAGEVRATLVQFSEAQAHGISSRVLGDGYSQEISRYWGELFDLDKDEFKTEIQKGWQTEGWDLLIVDAVQILPKFEKSGILLAALGRTIDLFSRSCHLVACVPDEMQAGPDPTVDVLEKETQSPRSFAQPKATASMQDECLKAGFRSFGATGIYLLSPTQQRPNLLLE